MALPGTVRATLLLSMATLAAAGCSDERQGGSGTPSAPLHAEVAAIVSVSSLAALQSAVNSAAAGTEIVLADGVYTAADWIRVAGRSGSASSPILIRAASNQGVQIGGSQGFLISGSSYITLQGFSFTHGTVGTAPAAGIRIEGCRNVRVTRCTFRLAEVAGATRSNWFVISGSGSADNRIDHCRFDNKITEGVFIAVYGPSDGMSQRDRIDHNHFSRHLFAGGEGGEGLRIGDSARQRYSAYATVEHNLFEQCNGDVEVISSKSSDNTYRYNTFRDNGGSVTLRHGHRCTVEGNFFLGGQTGIRFYGDDHRIVNNYFEGWSSSNINLAPIAIGFGTSTSDFSMPYDTPERALIAFNTFVNNARNIEIGCGGAETTRIGAIDCTVADNLIVGPAGTSAAHVYRVAAQSIAWRGNILHGGVSAGVMPADGYRAVDPLLAGGAGALYRLTSASPAINGSLDAGPADDMDGQLRTGQADIGCDEYSTTAVLRRPLTAADVGPGSSDAVTQPPACIITSPASGASLSGTATVLASASSGVGIAKVELLVDGLVAGSDSAAPYSFDWNTASAGIGPHSLTAKAYDVAGLTGISAAVAVTVADAPDTAPPLCSITSPANGATVSGKVVISAAASDPSGVARVEFFAGGSLLGTDTGAPYSGLWNSRPSKGQSVTITARAYDARGNMSATSITVRVP